MADPGLFRADRCPQSLLLGFIYPFPGRDRRDDPVFSRIFDRIGHHAAELHFRPASQYRTRRDFYSYLYFEIAASPEIRYRKIHIQIWPKNKILVNRNRRSSLSCRIYGFSYGPIQRMGSYQ